MRDPGKSIHEWEDVRPCWPGRKTAFRLSEEKMDYRAHNETYFSPVDSGFPLLQFVLRAEILRVVAERDKLRAALVEVVGVDDPGGLEWLIRNDQSVDYVDAEKLAVAARVLLEVRP